MKNPLYLFMVFLPLITGCSKSHTITVENSSALDRQELAEISLEDVQALCGDSPVRLLDANGVEIPYQQTYDNKLVFPVAVKANSSTDITVEYGKPALVDTISCGAFYPERKDDLAWENDMAAYRAYGPALQASEEHAYGYDIWTKSVTKPVVKQRYLEAFTLDKSFHEDHGDGMDVYTVGPTLGGGAAALIDSVGNIVYPWCFSSFEILDNGPLRFTVKLHYGNDETRLISLDAGEFLNRTEVCFNNPEHTSIAAGIVLHRQNPEGYALSPNEGYMAYADLTDNADNGNGVIYIGVVTPEVDYMLNVPFDTPKGDAIGHILAKKAYNPGDCYVYYWGSGWSKGAMPDWQTWKKYLADFHTRIQNPLTVTIK